MEIQSFDRFHREFDRFSFLRDHSVQNLNIAGIGIVIQFESNAHKSQPLSIVFHMNSMQTAEYR